MNLKHTIFLLLATFCSVSAKRDSIRLKDVETLTLYSDRWTTSRRSAPVKQLTCTAGPCNRVTIDTAQCYNRGFDGNDVQWECKAELPSNYKFGRLEVSCEGYEYPDDDYILVGSCGLEYTISEVSQSSNSYFPSQIKVKDNYGPSMLTIVVLVGAAIALYFYFNARPNNTREQNSTSGRSQFNSNSSAPPPPGFRQDYYGDKTGDTSNTSGTSSAGSSNGPGFFSGMAAGSFLGYLFGSSNRGGNTGYGYGRRDHRDSSFWNAPSSSGYSSFGSLSSRGNSGTTRTSTSTAFASTKRR